MKKDKGSVLLVSANFYPKIGGPASSVPEIARILAERGYHVDVITSLFPGFPAKQEKDGYTIYRAPSTYVAPTDKDWLKDLNAVWHMSRLIRQRCRETSYSLIHCHDLNLSLIAAKMANTKLPILAKFTGDLAVEQQFASIRSLEDFERTFFAPPSLKFKFLGVVQGFIASWATLIASNSHFLVRTISGYGISPSKCVVVYNGISQKEIPPLKTKKSSRKRKQILYYGRLVPWKGVHVLIRAFDRLVESGMDAELKIIGNGPADKELKALASSLPSGDRIMFSPAVSQHEVVKRIQDCDVVALPSFYDPFPHGMVEALACGKPLVITNVGGVSEAITDQMTGWLVPPNDFRAMADAFADVLENPKKVQRISEAGRTLVLDRLTWERIVDQLITVYGRLRKE